MNSIERVLAILPLFTRDKRVWTADGIGRHFGVSTSQAYRYCKALVGAGLLDPFPPIGYTLGPAFIAFERVIQASDPLICAARPVMVALVDEAPPGATVLVSKLYRSRVMCLDQVVGHGLQNAISFERGRLMPLLWGATSKAILAFMTRRDLARIHHLEMGRSEHRPPTLAKLKADLAVIKRDGHCIARGEVDVGRVGIAAPIFGSQGAVLGSLTIAVPEEAIDYRATFRLGALVKSAALEVHNAMAEATIIAETREASRETPNIATAQWFGD